VVGVVVIISSIILPQSIHRLYNSFIHTPCHFCWLVRWVVVMECELDALPVVAVVFDWMDIKWE